MTASFAQDTLVITKKIVYKKVGNRELSVDLFYTAASQQKNNNTAIAFFHGGGWVFGDPSEFYEACKRYARKGYVTFSFQYRLSRNAALLKINSNKIVVGGQSAGGQLALATALLDSVNEITDNLKISPLPNALLLYSSNVNTMEAWVDMLLGDRREEIWSISPYHNLKKPMPPVIAFRGEEDNQVLPYTVGMFKAKMLEMGNYYEEYVYPGRKHYLAEGNKKYATYFDEEILEKTDVFLEKFGF